MIKAITLYEPWASLVALGEKKIETRSWYTTYRGPLLIHAAKKVAGDIIFTEPFYTALAPQHDKVGESNGIMFRGSCILAICNLVGCLEINSSQVYYLKKDNPNEYAFGDYTLGRFAWVLKDVHQLKEPIPCKGMQRLWNFDEAPHLVSIDPWVVGDTKIWTPKGVRCGKKLERPTEDVVTGLEVA